MERDPLFKYYALWLKNSEESARWLRSGTEYEDWFAARGWEVDMTPAEREARALEYDAAAARYRKRLEEGEFGVSTP